VSGRALRWLLSLPRPVRWQHANGTGPLLTIVRHHRVYAAGARPLYRLGVREDVLAAQLEMLAALGRPAVSVTEGLRLLEAGEPGHWVAMSFDDGYSDNVARALPLLQRYGSKATFYLAAGLIEQRVAPWWDRLAFLLESTRRTELPGGLESAEALPLADDAARRGALTRLLPWLRAEPATQASRLARLAEALEVQAAAPCELATWAEVRRLVEAGMEVGAHTLTHPFLSLLEPADQQREITGGLELIHQRLGVAATGLAYPGGDHDIRTIAIARGAGLEHAVTTRSGDNRRDAPRLELARRGLYEGACLGPGGRFSRRLAIAELQGAFDGLRRARQGISP
jgi:peptidoglycan/xylan/chitin deacetylase (PgdA/CDA1 family)